MSKSGFGVDYSKDHESQRIIALSAMNNTFAVQIDNVLHDTAVSLGL